jgi:hypothetical protein
MSEKKMPTMKPAKPFDKKAFIKAAGEFAKILEKEKTEKSA